MRKKAIIIILAGLGLILPASAIVPGFIFNAENIFLEMEESQGGVGFKIRDIDLGIMDVNIRGGLGMDFIDGSDVYNLSASVVLEVPFFETTRISPYVGILLRGSYNKLYVEIPPESSDPVSWSSTVSRPLNFGAVAGIECFLLDFLSIFVEYEAVMEINTTQLKSNETEPQKDTDVRFRMQMGNEGMIGVCFYFRPVVNTKKK